MGLTIRKRKGSKNYQIRGTVAGIYVEESAGTADKRAAALAASARELEIIKGNIVGRGQGATFLEASVAYLETLGGDPKDRKTAEQKRIVGKLLGHFETTPLAEIGQAEVEACALSLWPKVAAPTVRRYIGVLQALLNYAESRGQAADSAFKGYRALTIDKRKWPESKGRQRWITPAEAATFIEHAGADLSAFFRFVLYTGCRLSDALFMTWADVNLGDRLCIFADDKNGDDRQCHLPEPAFLALANLRREAVPGRVFFMWKDKKELYKDWHPTAEAAGLADVTPHILCHTYATWLVEYAEANAKDLLETKRWKSLTSVIRYLHAPEQRVRDKINALPGASAPAKKAQEA